MATLTKIVSGSVNPSVSDVVTVTDESFTSAYDLNVRLQHSNLVAASTVVTSTDGLTTYTEGAGDDYVMDNTNGLIQVLSTGTMDDAAEYLIDYEYNEPDLAWKINLVTSTAQAAGKTIYKVATAKSGNQGLAVIVYQA